MVSFVVNGTHGIITGDIIGDEGGKGNSVIAFFTACRSPLTSFFSVSQISCGFGGFSRASFSDFLYGSLLFPHQSCQRQCHARQDRPRLAPIFSTDMLVFAIKTILLTMKTIFDSPMPKDIRLKLLWRYLIRIKTAHVITCFLFRLFARSACFLVQTNHRTAAGNVQLLTNIFCRPLLHPQRTFLSSPLFYGVEHDEVRYSRLL